MAKIKMSGFCLPEWLVNVSKSKWKLSNAFLFVNFRYRFTSHSMRDIFHSIYDQIISGKVLLCQNHVLQSSVERSVWWIPFMWWCFAFDWKFSVALSKYHHNSKFKSKSVIISHYYCWLLNLWLLLMAYAQHNTAQPYLIIIDWFAAVMVTELHTKSSINGFLYVGHKFSAYRKSSPRKMEVEMWIYWNHKPKKTKKESKSRTNCMPNHNRPTTKCLLMHCVMWWCLHSLIKKTKTKRASCVKCNNNNNKKSASTNRQHGKKSSSSSSSIELK